MKDSKNYVIAALCLVLCIMAVGFAAFSSNLSINSTATIGSNWKVKFAAAGETVGAFTDLSTTSLMTSANGYKGCELNTADGGVALDSSLNTVTVDATTFTMSVSLNQPGDSVTCYALIANEGTINAKVGSVTNVLDQSDEYILFSDDSTIPVADDILAAGAAVPIKVTATYRNTAQGTPNTPYSVSYTKSLNYVQYTGA